MKLSLTQKDIYFDQLLFPDQPIYTLGARIEIEGSIHPKLFEEAYNDIISQHDILHSFLIKKNEYIEFQTDISHYSKLEYLDFSKDKNTNIKVDAFAKERMNNSFNLAAPKELYTSTLIKIKENHYHFYFIFHHIISDGWGASLMFQRLVENYNELTTHGSIKTTYSFPYQDFVEDDIKYQNSDSFIKDKVYWLDKFQNLPDSLFQKKTSLHFKNERKKLVITRKIYDELINLAKSYRSSTFHVLLALIYIYFGRKHKNTDFAIGVPILNRSKSTFKKTVGVFMSVLPLRIQFDFDNTYSEVINIIKNRVKEDYRHQRFPMGELVNSLKVFHEKEKLFNIMLSYEKHDYSNDFSGTRTKVTPLSHRSEKVALAIYIREFDKLEDVEIDFDYNLDYFDSNTINYFISHFEKMIIGVTQAPNKKIKEIDFLATSEKNYLLTEVNQTYFNLPKAKTFLDIFRDSAEKFPLKEAVKDDQKSYSYLELDQFSDQIATHISKSYDNKDKSPIVLLMERSCEMIVILLGILKSGRAYICLDPNYPKERLEYIIASSKALLLLCQKNNISINTKITVLPIDKLLEDSKKITSVLNVIVIPSDTMYIIYTSGSTGVPKGVEIKHESLLNLLLSIKKEPGFTSSDLLFSVTTPSFDISILEFFLPVISGGTVYIASKDVLSNPSLIIQRISEIHPTIIQATPSFYNMLFEYGWNGMKTLKVFCGGEALSKPLSQKLLDSCAALWNLYGPTETTIYSCIKEIKSSDNHDIIGKPIDNTQIYILDDFLYPAPVNSNGSIYIGGKGLAKGYYGNISLTQERFISNPFIEREKIYATGDIGKWNEKGEVQYIGRNDDQVKIRGYRIELKDIENNLMRLSLIKQATALTKKEGDHTYLIAYYTATEEIDHLEIRKELEKILPFYMIPHFFVKVDEMPLTPNKKVDRKELLKINFNTSQIDDYVAPESDIEKSFVKIWQDVLGVDNIGINDSFFELGGDSLKVYRIMSKVKDSLGIMLDANHIFKGKTIKGVLELINAPEEQAKVKKDAFAEEVHQLFYDNKGALYKENTTHKASYDQRINWKIQKSNPKYMRLVGGKVVIDQKADVDSIKKTVKILFETHPVLGLSFRESDGQLFQVYNKNIDHESIISIIEINNSTEGEQIITSHLSKMKFNLEEAPIIRFIVLKSKENFKIIFISHHILMDGWAINILQKDFSKIYSSFVNGKIPNIEKPKASYLDYSNWKAAVLENSKYKQYYKSTWKEYLDGYHQKTHIPYDHTGHKNVQSGTVQFFLNPHETSKIRKLSSIYGVTKFTILMSCLFKTIHKITNDNKIGIGIANPNRNFPELYDVIGEFANPSIVVQNIIADDEDFVNNVSRNLNNILQLPLLSLAELGLQKEVTDLFSVMINMISYEELKDVEYQKEIVHLNNANPTRWDLGFYITEHTNVIKVVVKYTLKLYKPSTIEKVIETFIKEIELFLSRMI